MPLTALLPGQQHTPNARKAMPSTRATAVTIPVNSAPNNKRPTSDVTISNATPVAASATAATVSTFFISLLLSVARLVVQSSDGFGLGFFVIGSHLRWFEFDGQLVELASEAERRLVILIVNPRASIHPDIKGLINRHQG